MRDRILSHQGCSIPLRSPLSATLRLLAVAAFTTFGVSDSSCGVSCKPILAIEEARLSEVQSSQRIWTAILVADSSYCATSSGMFEIDFIRLKETAPDLQFTEQFTWTTGQFAVSMALWADEAIFDYRIGFVAPCVCRDPPW
jgi:hypothetical protein